MLTALPAPTEHRTEESGEKAEQYTQLWCPLSTFIMFPVKQESTFMLEQHSYRAAHVMGLPAKQKPAKD